MGYGSAFLLGDPNYYQRFGYKQASLFDISHEAFSAEYLMVKELAPDALNGVTGIAST